MSLEAELERIVVNEEEDEKEELLCLSDESISVDMFYVILDYKPLCGNNEIVEESIKQLVCLDG